MHEARRGSPWCQGRLAKGVFRKHCDRIDLPRSSTQMFGRVLHSIAGSATNFGRTQLFLCLGWSRLTSILKSRNASSTKPHGAEHRGIRSRSLGFVCRAGVGTALNGLGMVPDSGPQPRLGHFICGTLQDFQPPGGSQNAQFGVWRAGADFGP